MKYRGKVLFIDKAHADFAPALEALGFECESTPMEYADLMACAREYTGYVIRSRFAIDAPLIDASCNLKFIARIGAGMENIDVAYAQSKGIACLNSPEGNADAVGEYVIGGIMNMLRHTMQSNSQVKQGEWLRETNRGWELGSQTVGIVGYGNMGHSLAKKLSGFGCRVLVYDKYKPQCGDAYATQVPLEVLQKESDIVSVHINYTIDNHYYINESFLNAFSKNIYVINTSRGKVLDTCALWKALQSGKVKGAVLDVLEYENIRLQNKPMQEWNEVMHGLAHSDKVILSPHIAGQTYESLQKHVKVLVEKIKQLPYMQ